MEREKEREREREKERERDGEYVLSGWFDVKDDDDVVIKQISWILFLWVHKIMHN